MDAARLPPRGEDEVGSSPAFSHMYRITVEEPDGSTHEHEFEAPTPSLGLGQVIVAGEDGWGGPTIAIEEIDRHPDDVQAGAALAHPTVARR
jgi:hypothetical protein